jgi:DNA helicase HerA-like ATPase
MTNQFIVWADSLSSDAYQIEALSYERDTAPLPSQPSDFEAKRPPIAAGDFVIIQDKSQGLSWFGQVVEPQRNLPLLGLSRDNPSQVTALRKVLNGEVEVSVFLKQVYYYRINLLGEIEGNHLQSVKRRPRVGAAGQRATAEEALQYMNLPELYKGDGLHNNILGRFHGLPIPITLDKKRIFYHTLTAGSTGSGKSNTIGNYIKAAQAYDMACVVFDHKPDYQEADQPNDEVELFDSFVDMGLKPFGLEDVDYFAPYKKRDESLRDDECSIVIGAMHVDISMLAAALFYRPGEELQQETFARMLENYAEGKRSWTLKQFQIELVKRKREGTLSKLNDDVEPHELVIMAIVNKILTRKPEWMDADLAPSTRSGMLAGVAAAAPEYFRPEQHLKPGRVMVIRIPTSSGGREYGLFLSYMLRKVFNLRRTSQIKFPVCVVIDEAQDIFSGSRAVRASAEGTINSVLRKGRSQRIGFVISVQSASQVPSSILNNLNSRIIHLQQERDELRNALPGTPKELANMVLSFGPGEALVKLFGAKSTIHAKMAPSPFKLTKEEI